MSLIPESELSGFARLLGYRLARWEPDRAEVVLELGPIRLPPGEAISEESRKAAQLAFGNEAHARSPISFSQSCSVIVVTPSSAAFFAFDPASAPMTT